MNGAPPVNGARDAREVTFAHSSCFEIQANMESDIRKIPEIITVMLAFDRAAALQSKPGRHGALQDALRTTQNLLQPSGNNAGN